MLCGEYRFRGERPPDILRPPTMGVPFFSVWFWFFLKGASGAPVRKVAWPEGEF